MADRLQEQLTNLAWSLKAQLLTAADMLDRQADIAASLIRGTLAATSWLPEAARPLPPAPPPTPLVHAVGLGRWVRDNKWAVGIAAATGVGIGAWVYGKRRQRGRAGRRARRAADGGRKEVVVLAGSPHDPLARGLALDLERRGFIVFVVVSSVEDEQAVLGEGRGDVRPLNIDIADPASSQSAIDKFHTYLSTPAASFPGAHPHRLHLAGLVLLPTGPSPTGPLAALPLEHWSDTLHLKLLAPILATKLLLRALCDALPRARIVLCTPAVLAPLAPPFHAPECAAVAALQAVAASLRRELAPRGVHVCLVKLGTFDVGGRGGGGAQVVSAGAARADTGGWAPAARAAYAAGRAAAVRGSPVRELHGAVAEALAGPAPRSVVCVGGGSVVYGVLGRWAPEWLVGWLVRVGAEEGGRGGGGAAAGSEGEWERV